MTKKSDSVVYTTADRRMLARAAIHMNQSGVNLRSMSEMLRIIIEIHDAWIDKQGARHIESTEEATNILQDMFRASLNPGNRYKKALLENLQKDEVDFTTIDYEPQTNGIVDENIKRTFNAIYGIKSESKYTPEQIEEFKRQALATNEASIEQPLTQTQIERNKAILIAMQAKIAPHREAIANLKTEKPKEHHQIAISKLIKLAEQAKDDDEAFRILIDED